MNKNKIRKENIMFTLKRVLFLLLPFSLCQAQDIDSVLVNVNRYNPEIITCQKLLEARKLEARTNLTPPDPEVMFGYMFGNTTPIGDKKTLNVTQSFDFPLKYLYLNRLSRNQLMLAEDEFAMAKLNVLLKTKQLYVSIVYKTKYLGLLNERLKNLEKLKSAWSIMLREGKTDAIAYNRIILEYSAAGLKVATVKAELRSLQREMSYQTGSKIENLVPVSYPSEEFPPVDSVIKIKTAVHPAFRMPVTEYQVAKGEIRVSRMGSLPSFQAGYSSEVVPGEKYAGPVVGLSVPLWSNTNRVKSAGAFSERAKASMEARLSALESELRGDHEKAEALGKAIKELDEVLAEAGSEKLPDKALLSGEISVTEYFSVIVPAYEARERYLEIQYEYYSILSAINDYKLLKY